MEEPADEPAANDPSDEPWMELARLYRRRWVTIAILACVTLTALLVVPYVLIVWAMATASGGLEAWIVVDLVHALIYLVSPMWGWSAARQAAREASWGAEVGGWLVSRSSARG